MESWTGRPRGSPWGEDPATSKAGQRNGVRLPDVQVKGAVADLGPCYRDCALVVVPVRAGGGTRIKLLEAMAHARPVVATRIGAEGLAVQHETHLLLADEPLTFAHACLELLREAEARHGEYEPTAPKHQWPEWYAEYIVARERGKTPDEAANHAALRNERK